MDCLKMIPHSIYMDFACAANAVSKQFVNKERIGNKRSAFKEWVVFSCFFTNERVQCIERKTSMWRIMYNV
ncbi:hypothetical protein HMPREF0083_05457 [Aneurinibacillus aneurinilyticus ATCC 12856]|uniref:Uncharacterized protein n=1 Tax=Aneurinibacillus aneurinilyticus ATCC 12856 TaxID=649747 RepID=U1WTA5_ANEAE|nr:hypothetical protein HMPREF0083_05457 [Aneurinibacillus aneurinilyticus ATCC 12856]